MKWSDLGNAPPPPQQPDPQLPQRPALTPDEVRVVQLERAFAADLTVRRPYGTWAIVATCVAAYLLQMSTDVNHGPLTVVGENYGEAVRAGQWWRLWSCTFLHGSVMHIGMNMWALWALGPFVEKIVGTPRFLVLYALAGLAGSMASAWFHPEQTSVGASGAIWGLMGAAMGLAVRPKRLLPPLTAQNMKRRLVQPLLVNLAISFLPGIDALAHLGGGAAGFVLMVAGAATAGAPARWSGEVEPLPSRTAWSVLAGACCLAMLASLGAAVLITLAQVR